MTNIINKLKKQYKSNSKLIKNVIAAFLIKGSGFLVSIVGLPLYISYFENKSALGVWFTMLTLVGWILSFDIGVGNGLRNKLTIAIAEEDYEKGKRLISSAYGVMGVMTVVMAIIVATVCGIVNWNAFFNIEPTVLDRSTLTRCVTTIMTGILGCFFFQIVRGQIYALQLSSVNNFLHMSANVLMIAILFVLPKDYDIATKFTTLSIAYAIIVNLPYTIATVIVHRCTILKRCAPSIKYITRGAAKAVVGLGITFFVVQILHMIISVTNEWFISSCFDPKYCVDYQVYFRLFSLLGTLIMLALTPLWSAITKAYAEKRYMWIYKLNKFLSLIALGAVIVQCVMLLLLQPIINLWLGENAITVNYITALIFLTYSVEMIWISVQSTIVAGLGKLNTQLVFYSIAVVVKVAMILIVSKIFPEHWEIVMLATAIGLLPYCLIQPAIVTKLLKKLVGTDKDVQKTRI